jgi:uncharacterized protein (DUF2062 family)
MSVALGMGVGTLPLWGLHSILIILLCGAWKLNKIAALAASQLCIPPLVPALCVEVGYFIRNGHFLTDISLQTLGYEALDRILEWLIGSLPLAPTFAALFGVLTYCLALAVKKNLEKTEQGG